MRLELGLGLLALGFVAQCSGLLRFYGDYMGVYGDDIGFRIGSCIISRYTGLRWDSCNASLDIGGQIVISR